MAHNVGKTSFANWLLSENGPSDNAYPHLIRNQLKADIQNGDTHGVETLADLRALAERSASDLDNEVVASLWERYLDWKTANEIEADEVSLGAELLLDEGELIVSPC